jgi:hypothetical protein
VPGVLRWFSDADVESGRSSGIGNLAATLEVSRPEMQVNS